MGDLALKIADAEGWRQLDAGDIDAFAGESDTPAAVFFPGAKANRRETDDVAVVLRELARAGHVRAGVIAGGEGAAKTRFGVVAAPSLLVIGPGGASVVPLIADWTVYLDALRTARREIAA